MSSATLSATIRAFLYCAFAAALSHSPAALAADADEDALALSSAPVAAADGAAKTKLFVEGAIGAGSSRDGSGTRSLRRASIDLTHASTFAPGWRAVISDRLDHIRPVERGADETINSLREAYVSWQQASGDTVVDVGRVNLRYGPGYGYNPTDFFRDGSLRTVTSINPFTLRENRLGSVVIRGQRLWADGSVSLAYSPKLESEPSADGFNLDLGATNNRDRGLLALSSQLSQRLSGQVLLYKERGLPAQWGASLTALLTDAALAHAEWSRGREPDLFSRAVGVAGVQSTRNRFVGGLTYTTASKLSVTAEYQYNGFALSPPDWEALGQNAPVAQGAYVLESLRRQDLASRDAWLVYVTQKSIGLKNLDLTALLRVNGGDHSRLGWIELRHHWDRFDLALQLQQQSGRNASEFGLIPDRRSAQLLASYYF